MIHSEEESVNSFTPESQEQNPEEHKNKDSKNMPLLINQFVFNYYAVYFRNRQQQRMLLKSLVLIFQLQKQYCKLIERKEELERKTRERNKIKQESGENSSPRKIQSMYNLEQPQQMRATSPEQKPQIPQIQPIFPVMSSPNLDNNGAQIALALCQRELAQQKLINFQLLMMIQNFKNISQLQVKEEPNIIN